MTPAKAYPVAVLCDLFKVANRRRDLLDKLRALLDEVERGGREISGERGVWETAQSLLLRVTASLESVQEAVVDVAVTREMLDAPEWDLLEQVAPELGAAVATQRTAIEKIRELLSGLDIPLQDALLAIEQGRVALAPTRDAANSLKSARIVVDQVKGALERTPAIAFVRRVELEQARPKLEASTTQLRRSIEYARLNLRHSELVMIRTPGDALDDYSVLFRTPAEPGAHGVYVRGTTTVVPKDREFIFEALDAVSKTLLSGARRDQTVAPAAMPGVPVPAPPPSVTPAPAPIVNDTVRGGLTPPPPNLTATTTAEEAIADIGDLVFKLFLPEPMQAYLRRTPCAMTFSTNDLDLPWELMRYDDQVLCLARCVGRLPIGNTFPRLDRPQPLNNPRVRFLLICADDTGNLKGAKQEIARIREALTALTPADSSLAISIDVLDTNVTGRTLNRKLRYEDYNVIHYAGHARFDAKHPERSALVLDNGELFLAQKIRRILVGRPLVFLNACDSARTPAEEATTAETAQTITTYLQEPAEGLAASFLYGGALGCIGSLWPVYDEPASDFAISFYRHVLAGHVIGEAMRLARCETKEKHKQHLTWATFVLYGNPTFQLQS
jgi:hypothetical protein